MLSGHAMGSLAEPRRLFLSATPKKNARKNRRIDAPNFPAARAILRQRHAALKPFFQSNGFFAFFARIVLRFLRLKPAHYLPTTPFLNLHKWHGHQLFCFLYS